MFYEKELIEKNLYCLNCNQRYNTPKYLPCGSIICDCYKNSTINESSILCPFCKNEHRIPSNGFPIVKQLLNLLNAKPIQVEEVQNKDSNFDKLSSNINCIIEMENKLQEFLNNTQTKIKGHYQTIRSQVEINFKKAVEQLEEYKNELIYEINLNEAEYFKDDDNGEWNDAQNFLLKTQEKIKNLNPQIGSGDNNQQQLVDILTETESIKNQLEIFIQMVDKACLSTSKIVVYKEPTFNRLSQSSEFYSDLLGSLEYQDYNYLMHNGNLNIYRLQEKYQPKVLNYKYFDNNDYKIIDTFVATFLESKFVMCTYRMIESINYYEITIKLFDYANEFQLDKESWELSNCHLYDMIAFDKSILLSIRNQTDNLLIQIYDEYLQLVKSFEHQFFADSIFANDNYIFVVDIKVPFIHAYDWNLTEIKAFGQNHSPTEPYFMTFNDKLLIKFNKIYTIDIYNFLIKIYSIENGTLFKIISLENEIYISPTNTSNRVIITVDNEEKLIVVLLDKKFINVYSSIVKSNFDLLYQHDASEISVISSISVTKEGILAINDLITKQIYLY